MPAWIIVGWVGCLGHGAARGADVILNELCAGVPEIRLQWTRDGVPRLGAGHPWQAPDYEDGDWFNGAAPFGFGYSGLGTDTGPWMTNRTPTLYLRTTFVATAAHVASNATLFLDADYDDGFIAFLNGVEVARRYAGPSNLYHYSTQQAFGARQGGLLESIPLGLPAALLNVGTNHLAVQVANVAITDRRCLFSARIRLGLPLADWRQPAYDAAAWERGPGPLGYDSDPHYAPGTNLYSRMYNKIASVYHRHVFVVDETDLDPESARTLTFDADYDDGFVAYLNGAEVARRNLGATGATAPCAMLATATHAATGESGTTTSAVVTFDLGLANGWLRAGTNVLALQVHNASLNSSDLILRANLRLNGDPPRLLAAQDQSWSFRLGSNEPPLQIMGGSEATEEGLLLSQNAQWRWWPGLVDPSADGVDPALLTQDSEPMPGADWIELWNRGAAPVALAGWSLSDDPGKPDQWRLPATDLPPGGFLVILADGLVTSGVTARVHAPFKLAMAGEFLGLYDPTGGLADVLAPAYPSQNWQTVYARRPGGGAWAFTATGTPGRVNAGPFHEGVAPAPVFADPSGFYTGNVPLTLTCPMPEAQIRYTTDGREPTADSGIVYTSTVTLTASRAIRAAAFREGWRPSPIVTRSYLIKESTARRSLPAVTLVGDPDRTLYAPCGVTAIQGGIRNGGVWTNSTHSDYNMPMQREKDAERPGVLGMIATNGMELWQTDCGVRLAGSAYTRPRVQFTKTGDSPWPSDFTQKPGFNFFMRDEYGADTLAYPVFGPDRVAAYETIRLRAGHNDMNPFIIDELVRRIYGNTGQWSCRGLLTTLYVNASYKGFFNLTERARESTFRQWHGGDAAWDVRQVTQIADGDSVFYDNMLASMESHTLAILENYTEAATLLDVDNFIDYMIVNTYVAMGDWPNNNYVAARERNERGRYRFYVWDGECAFGTQGWVGKPVTVDMFSKDYFNISSGQGKSEIARLFRALYASPEFKLRWADRVQRHFFDGGALTEARMAQEFEPLVREMKPLLTNITTNWFWPWMDQRRGILFPQMAGYGLWPACGAPTFAHPGGVVPAGFAIEVTHTNADGAIYLALDGGDPRAPGGNPRVAPYAGPVAINHPCRALARARRENGTWSPVVERVFLPPSAAEVIVSEIMYNPESNTRPEFLELFNAGTAPAYLGGMMFTKGIDFTFPDGTTLEPGAFLVLTDNWALFTNAYPGIIPFGVFANATGLSKSGERVTLVDLATQTVVTVSYDDKAPWPLTADGGGYSLAPRHPVVGQDWDDPAVWRASHRLGGSPGAADLPLPVQPVLINEALTHTDPPDRDTIELFNPGPDPAPVGGWFLSDDPAMPAKYRIPDGVTLPAGGYWLVDETLFFDGNPRLPFRLDSHGEGVYLFSADAAGDLTGYRHGFVFGGAFNGISFGRHVISTGAERFPPQIAGSLGSGNAGPCVGPVIISELMYSPGTGQAEYVEIVNITDAPVPLYHPDHPSNTWRLAGVGPYPFPEGIVLPAEHHAIITALDPVVFRTTFGIPDATLVLGPFEGNLADAGERIVLQAPDAPDLDEAGVVYVPYVEVDAVEYDNAAPWPAGADGTGHSLERFDVRAFGDDPVNWRTSHAVGGTPGFGLVLDYEGWCRRLHDGLTPHPDLFDPTADPDDDGAANWLEYAFGTEPLDSESVPVFGTTFEVDDETFLMLELQVRRGSAQRGLSVDFAPDPEGPWTSLPEAGRECPAQQVTADGFETRRVRDSVSHDDAPRRFLRLRWRME